MDKRLPDRRNSICFERTTLPPETQLSAFPEEDEEGVRYFRGIDASDGQAGFFFNPFIRLLSYG